MNFGVKENILIYNINTFSLDAHIVMKYKFSYFFLWKKGTTRASVPGVPESHNVALMRTLGPKKIPVIGGGRAWTKAQGL